jgi:hypothetical protein
MDEWGEMKLLGKLLLDLIKDGYAVVGVTAPLLRSALLPGKL